MKALVAALMAVALLAGCGGGGGTQPAGSIKATMTEYAFDPSSISAPAGKVVFWLVNSGNIAHDMVISNTSGNRVAASELVSAGDTFTFTVDNLQAGSYKIFCNQPGHEASGMKGTLTVT